jgi:hypothetical protein
MPHRQEGWAELRVSTKNAAASELESLELSLNASLATLHELTVRLRGQCERVLGAQPESVNANTKEIASNCMLAKLHQAAGYISVSLEDLRSCVGRIERL